MKVKRKELEEVNDDFSEFSLNSPAQKIRRLDVDLPPIMEEEEPSFSMQFEQMNSSVPHMTSAMAEVVPSFMANEERALVLYKPRESPLSILASSPSVSVHVSSGLINGLKHQVFWSGSNNAVTIEELPMDDKSPVSVSSLAVVPWVQSPNSSATDTESRGMIVEEPMEAEEPMEGEEPGDTSMEVEEDRQQCGTIGEEGFHQWPQHCMAPQIPQSNSMPIMWSWG